MVTLLAGTLAILAAIALGSAVPLPVAGACFTASGLAAFAGRRSVLVPRTVRSQLDDTADPEERRQVEQASGMMTGSLLVFFGLIGLAVGLWITLA